MKPRNPLLAASIAAALGPDEKTDGNGITSVIQESDGDSEFAGLTPTPSFLQQAAQKNPRPGPASVAKNLMAKLVGSKKAGKGLGRRSGLRRK